MLTASMIVNQLKLCKQNKEWTEKFRENIRHPMKDQSARRRWKLDLKKCFYFGCCRVSCRISSSRTSFIEHIGQNTTKRDVHRMLFCLVWLDSVQTTSLYVQPSNHKDIPLGKSGQFLSRVKKYVAQTW